MAVFETRGACHAALSTVLAAAVSLCAACGGADVGAGTSSTATAATSPPAGAGSIPVPPGEAGGLPPLVEGAAPGAVIDLEAGEYLLDGTLRLGKAITLRGAGSGDTVLVGGGSGPVVTVEGGGPVVLSGMTIRNDTGIRLPVVSVIGATFSLSDVVVTGGRSAEDGAGGRGIEVSGSSDGRLDDTVVTGNDGAAMIAIDGAALLLTGCELSGNGGGGLALFDTSTAGVSASEISGNGSIGLRVRGSARVEVEDAAIELGTETGVEVAEEAEATVTASRVSGNGAHGFYLGGDAVLTLDRSVVEGNAKRGIQAIDRSSVSGSGSVVRENGGMGLILFDSTSARIENWAFTANGSNAIEVKDDAMLSVSGSEFTGHRAPEETDLDHSGVAVVATAGTSITGCRFIDNDDGIALAVGVSADVEMEGNTFSGNDEDVDDDVEFVLPEGTEAPPSTTTTTTMAAAEATWSDVELPEGTPYDGYEIVEDETGRILIGLPTAWSEHRSGPFSQDGGVYGFSLTASADVDAFISGHDTPGLFIGAATDLDIGVEEWLDQYDLSDACTFDTRSSYDTQSYSGLMDRWIDCGGTGAVLEILIAEPGDADGIVILQMRSLTQADRVALSRALVSFVIDYV
ncbi:MAG: right-handed parallel beta-helix repeat-containing protein [Actinobacteria bacterium]|nr:right-handed parallel beta-helix repeat-containing protein [Actinomycetota bacterium]